MRKGVPPGRGWPRGAGYPRNPGFRGGPVRRPGRFPGPGAPRGDWLCGRARRPPGEDVPRVGSDSGGRPPARTTTIRVPRSKARAKALSARARRSSNWSIVSNPTGRQGHRHQAQLRRSEGVAEVVPTCLGQSIGGEVADGLQDNAPGPEGGGLPKRLLDRTVPATNRAGRPGGDRIIGVITRGMRDRCLFEWRPLSGRVPMMIECVAGNQVSRAPAGNDKEPQCRLPGSVKTCSMVWWLAVDPARARPLIVGTWDRPALPAGGPGFGEAGRWSVYTAEPRLEFEATLGTGVPHPTRGRTRRYRGRGRSSGCPLVGLDRPGLRPTGTRTDPRGPTLLRAA